MLPADPAWSWFALTVAAETGLALVFVRPASHRRAFAAAVVAVNLVSFPIALFAHAGGASWFAVEACVLLFEAAGLAVLTHETAMRSACIAAALNGATAAAGCALALAQQS